MKKNNFYIMQIGFIKKCLKRLQNLNGFLLILIDALLTDFWQVLIKCNQLHYYKLNGKTGCPVGLEQEIGELCLNWHCPEF